MSVLLTIPDGQRNQWVIITLAPSSLPCHPMG